MSSPSHTHTPPLLPLFPRSRSTPRAFLQRCLEEIRAEEARCKAALEAAGLVDEVFKVHTLPPPEQGPADEEEQAKQEEVEQVRRDSCYMRRREATRLLRGGAPCR